MVHRPSSFGAFQFVVLANLRAAQLMRGCIPRVVPGHKHTITAQTEVAEGKVLQCDLLPPMAVVPAD